MTGVLTGREKGTQRSSCKDEAETGMMYLQTNGRQGLPAATSRWDGGMGWRLGKCLPQSLQEALPTPRFGLQTASGRERSSLLMTPPRACSFGWQPLETNTEPC